MDVYKFYMFNERGESLWLGRGRNTEDGVYRRRRNDNFVVRLRRCGCRV